FVSALLGAFHVLVDLFDGPEPGALRIDPETEIRQVPDRVPMRGQLRPALDDPQLIHPDPQRPARRDRGVLLPHRARGGVARVGEDLLALLGLTLVQLLVRLLLLVDLTAHLEKIWAVVAS